MENKPVRATNPVTNCDCVTTYKKIEKTSNIHPSMWTINVFIIFMYLRFSLPFQGYDLYL
jgi:hypothetical protein